MGAVSNVNYLAGDQTSGMKVLKVLLPVTVAEDALETCCERGGKI